MTTTLETPNRSLEERLNHLDEQLAELTTALHHQRAERDQLRELMTEVNAIARPAMTTITEQMATLDAMGYFAFAAQAKGVMDNVVTSFGPDDVKALGDNIVTILQTVREMTQPEVMELVKRSAETAQVAETEFATPPSTFALLRQMRDPEVRRGLARVMAVLHTVGEETANDPAADPSAATHT